MRRLAVRLAAVSMVIAAAHSTSADIGMRPMIAHVTLHRGTERTFDIKLANSEDVAFRCRLDSVDITQNAMGMPVRSTEKVARGCGHWLQFAPRELVLARDTTASIKCTVRAPFDASGAYYAFASTLFEPMAAPRAGAEVISHLLNSVVMVVVTGRERLEARLRIESVDFQASRDKSWQAAIRVSNTGNMHTRAKLRCMLTTGQGTAIEEGEAQIGQGYILAGCARAFPVIGKAVLRDGAYGLRTEIEVEGSRRPVIRTAFFSLSHGQITAGKSEAGLSESGLFTVQPGSVYVELPARARRSQAVQVLNLTDKELKLEPHVLAWSQDEDGNVIFPAQPDHGRYLAEALTVRPTTIAVRPHSRQAMRLTFAMPAQGEGEYYVAVALSPPGEKLPDDAYVLAERTVLLTAHATGTAKREAVISGLALEQIEDGGYQFQVAVKNTGNSRCMAQGGIEVLQGAETIDRLSFGSSDILLMPACQRRFAIAWPRVLKPGAYRAIASVRYAESQEAKKELAFEAEQGARGSSDQSGPAEDPK